MDVKLERVFRASAPLRTAPVAVRYLLATVIVLLFFVLRTMVAAWMGGYPFLLFFPAIILISVLFDRGTGVFAVLLSTVLAWYFFVPPIRSLALPGWQSALPLALYVTVGLFLAITIEALRSTAERLVRASEDLERADKLNKLLLEDINHRVKNHLASVNALLHLSFRDITDPEAKAAIREATGRIGVLAKLYTRLHLGSEATTVCARDYINSLCEDLREGVIGLRPVALQVDPADIGISSIQAVPVGLIINELVENALKYAFPGERPGTIEVRFGQDRDCQFELVVSDNGVGYDPGASRVGGGTRLVRALAQQLHGRLEQTGPPGTAYRLVFPPEAAPPPP